MEALRYCYGCKKMISPSLFPYSKDSNDLLADKCRDCKRKEYNRKTIKGLKASRLDKNSNQQEKQSTWMNGDSELYC